MTDERKPDWVEDYLSGKWGGTLRAAHETRCPVDKRWRQAVEKMRCLVKPDSQWAECLDFLVEEVERLKKAKKGKVK